MPFAEHEIVTTIAAPPNKAAAPRGKTSVRAWEQDERALRMLDVDRDARLER